MARTYTRSAKLNAGVARSAVNRLLGEAYALIEASPKGRNHAHAVNAEWAVQDALKGILVLWDESPAEIPTKIVLLDTPREVGS